MNYGRYRFIRQIGAGGYGEVLLARAIGAEGFERIVAIKRLRGDLAASQLKSFINEALIGGSLNHPNVVQVLDFQRLDFRDSSSPDFLLVMEYVDGIGLHEILKIQDQCSTPLITPALALHIAMQVCEGLHYAHTARRFTGDGRDRPLLRLVHRDIKPSNLMINRTGTVKIMDFGVAKSAANKGHSSTGRIKGTLRYLSPEQAEGRKEIGHESDLFSLGLVLCEAITGHPVYQADQEHLVLLQALHGQTREAIEEADAIAPGIGPILERCCRRDPEQRFRTAEAFSRELRALAVSYPMTRSLADVVTEALELREHIITSDDTSTETSFSIELKRMEAATARSAWDFISKEETLPAPDDAATNAKNHAPEDKPASRADFIVGDEGEMLARPKRDSSSTPDNDEEAPPSPLRAIESPDNGAPASPPGHPPENGQGNHITTAADNQSNVRSGKNAEEPSPGVSARPPRLHVPETPPQPPPKPTSKELHTRDAIPFLMGVLLGIALIGLGFFIGRHAPTPPPAGKRMPAVHSSFVAPVPDAVLSMNDNTSRP